MRGDCWGTWLIMLGFMDLRWPRVCRRSTSVLLKNVILNLASLIGIFKSSYDNVLRWMPQDLIDDKSTLVQVMVWCRQAPSHYLNQCWPRSPTPYGVIRPQCVLLLHASTCICIFQAVYFFDTFLFGVPDCIDVRKLNGSLFWMILLGLEALKLTSAH